MMIITELLEGQKKSAKSHFERSLKEAALQRQQQQQQQTN